MKSSAVPVAVSCLCLGALGGWFARGPGSGSSSGNSGTAGKAGATTAHGDSGRDQEFAAPPPRIRPEPTAEEDPALPSGDEDREPFLASLEADLKWRIGAWKSSLNLRPDQVAALEAAMKNSLSEAASAPPDNLDAASSASDLDDALAATLDPEQATRFSEWGERKAEAVREAKAGAELAEMEGNLILDPEQREAVRKALLDRQDNAPAASAQPPAPMIDPQMLQQIGRDLGEGMEDPTRFQAAAKIWIDRRIASEVEQMKPFLREDQLATWRQVVERKYAGWMH